MFAPAVNLLRPSTSPEHVLVNTSIKRLTAALAIVLPAAALVVSPVMAADAPADTTAKPHHSSVHKTSSHKSHSKKTTTTTPSAS